MVLYIVMRKLSPIQSIFQEILHEIVPLPEEIDKQTKLIKKVTGFIFNSAIPQDLSITFIEPQGSTGLKQTALRDSADIDLFIGLSPEIIFSQKFPSKGKTRNFIQNLFKKHLREWMIPLLKSHDLMNISMSYAEHPYVSAQMEGIDFDIILCFDISDHFLQENGPITAMDRTPHHTRFIQEKLSPDQRNDVIMFKYFLKSHHCYGDKSPVGRTGFIGYSAEILIVKYGSLQNLFQNFTELEHKVINCRNKETRHLNYLKHHSFAEFRRKFYPNDFLVILDPTDLQRNVGSSISPRAYFVIRDAIQAFLNNPTRELCVPMPIPLISDRIISVEERANYFYLEYQQIEEDHYTKFRDKLYSLMRNLLKEATFEATKELRFEKNIGELLFNEKEGIYVLAFYTGTPIISPKYLRIGPRKDEEPHYSKFLEKNPGATDRDNHITVEKSRSFIYFYDFLKKRSKELPIAKLELIHVGSAQDSDISEIGQQSIMNLHLNVVPYFSELKDLYYF